MKYCVQPRTATVVNLIHSTYVWQKKEFRLKLTLLRIACPSIYLEDTALVSIGKVVIIDSLL